jgi:hypothetical protein
LICFVTTPGHAYAIRGLQVVPRPPGVPDVQTIDYHTLFRSSTLPRATYVFADIERLYRWERRLAAERFGSMSAAGLRCLNNPARVLTRYPLLRALARAKINSFDVYAADDAPRPRRFPVFVRSEAGHEGATSALLRSQEALDEHLVQRQAQGESLSDCIVVEYADARRPDGLWAKSGTFRIGNVLHYDHTDYLDGWIVKNSEGNAAVWTDAIEAAEREAVMTNAVPDAVRRAFEMSGIEWGRADHASTAAGDVVFEINTNPYVAPLRRPADLPYEFFARRRLVALLARIDSADGPPVDVEPGKLLRLFTRRGMLKSAEPLRP